MSDLTHPLHVGYLVVGLVFLASQSTTLYRRSHPYQFLIRMHCRC